MKIQIVPIEDEYEETVIDLILNIQQNEFNVAVTLADQPDLQDIKNFYYEGGGCFWGAFIDGQLVGTIALKIFSEDAGAIRKMFVKQDYRGKELGIAQQLLENLILYSREKGLNDLYLGTVSILKAALRFYEKNYFVQIGKEDLPGSFPLMSADNVYCHLILNA
ncbi:GNAT family N-acetyltransferase [Pedobacter hartonius]|uniref:Acetyltransferase (GNAT) domain-containing protein n=1 Tax=Pedobacter hartonius TaxID=425514 RepID=A0A1H4G9M8_9SPHI|nr:GNAT family N-acetyltransferase [Pedobacter hartonius]SEB06147.1 Acetyltransferase (GNAT) domain-containing protein [Pedobacter hartonius]